jgi:hypothetical protein
MDNRLATAKHEAGHAIVAHARGVPVFSIELHAEGASIYHETPEILLDAGQDATRVSLTFALIAAAGEAAVPEGKMSGADNENLRRALWLGGWPEENFYAFRGALVEQAAEIIGEHQDALDRVAGALVERGMLSGREVTALIGGADV